MFLMTRNQDGVAFCMTAGRAAMLQEKLESKIYWAVYMLMHYVALA